MGFYSFQFQNGSINSTALNFYAYGFIWFQFQNGSINSSQRKRRRRHI